MVCTAHAQLRMIILCLLLLSNGGTLSYPVASHSALALDHTTEMIFKATNAVSQMHALVICVNALAIAQSTEYYYVTDSNVH